MDLNISTFKVGCSRNRSVTIQDDANVIEIGGGANPCMRANVVTNHNHAKNQRDAPIKRVKGAKMLDCDVQDMKIFGDNEFDFLVCVQVLEHVEFPDVACQEIMRISKRGYIETPAILCEQLLGWSFHKWFVRFDERNKNKLVFIRKNNVDFKHFDNFFHDLFYKNNPNREQFKQVYFKYPEQFLISLYWENDFEYEVIQ